MIFVQSLLFTLISSGYIQPCQSWRYNSTVSGYVCSYYSMSTRYVEQQDFDAALRRIDQLENRVDDLEDRVERLENPPAPTPSN